MSSDLLIRYSIFGLEARKGSRNEMHFVTYRRADCGAINFVKYDLIIAATRVARSDPSVLIAARQLNIVIGTGSTSRRPKNHFNESLLAAQFSQRLAAGSCIEAVSPA